jgi:hypothetical protein
VKTDVRRKPKFRKGQVVAIFHENGHVPDYCRIESYFFDCDDNLRYTFSWDIGDIRVKALSPVEEILRPLTRRERGGQP